MNTPNVQTVMPGDCYDGPDPDGALTRDQFVTLLEDFAGRNALPIEPDTAVSELTHENGAYRLTTSHGTLWARNVIVASGSLNCPVRPVWGRRVVARSPPDRRFRLPQRCRSARWSGAGGRKRPIGCPDRGGIGGRGSNGLPCDQSCRTASTALPGSRHHGLAARKRVSRRAPGGGHSTCGTHSAAWCARVGAHDKPSGAQRPGCRAAWASHRHRVWRQPLVCRRSRSECPLCG